MIHAALKTIFADDERPARETERLITLMDLFADLPAPPDPFSLYGDYETLQARFLAAIEENLQ